MSDPLDPVPPRLQVPGAPSPSGGADTPACMSCGSPLARPWSTRDGTAWLCRECATLHGLSCP